MNVASTGKHLAMLRRQGLAKRSRPLPRVSPPKPIEREYGKALRKAVARWRGAFAQLFAELPSIMASARAGSVRGDAVRLDAGESKRVRDIVEKARAKMMESVDVAGLEALAAKFAQQTSTYQRIQLNKQTKAAFGVDLYNNDSHKMASTVEAFVDSNVGLIQNLGDKTANDIQAITLAAVQDGKLHGDLADDLHARFDIGERKAALIARDQVGKLYGQVNAIRQKDVGVSQFIWRTASDERVRPEHEARDGETYSYDDPPDGELPGEPILCRCYAEPDFTSILNEATETEIPESHRDIHDEQQVRTIDARAIESRGYYEPAAGFDDGQRLENSRKAIREGQREPITLLVGKTGKLEVGNGRHRLAAAIELGAKVKVNFRAGVDPGNSPGIVKKGGKSR